MLATDYLAIAIVLVACMYALLKAGRTNARLERENSILRSRVYVMRKRMNEMTEKPF